VRLDPVATFAARRRQVQDDAISALLPVVTAWLNDPGPTTRAALLRRVTALYQQTYRDEGGDRRPRPTQVAAAVSRALGRSTADTDPQVLATLLAVTVTNAATVQAALDDPEPLVLEWVTMHDSKVRHTHADVEGDQRPPGETFSVGGENLLYPGQPVGDPAIWINCRCTLAPVLASEASNRPPVASDSGGVTMTDTTTEPGIENADGRPTGLPAPTPTPWHGVLAPEGKWSGDGRRFAENALSTRDLPLPLTWQKASSDGHQGSVVVARIDQVERVDGEMRATGEFLGTAEADEVVGLLADFGRFGVSVDADDAEFEFDADTDRVTFTHARISSASIVSIPAFAEAWVGLGRPPEGFLPEPTGEFAGSMRPECNPDSEEYDPAKCRDGYALEDGFRDVGTKERKRLADKGAAMPDGSYPIANCGDLKNAIQAIGRAKDPAKVKAHIKKRKNALGCPDVSIPEGWEAEVDEFHDGTEFGRGPGWITNPEATRRIHDYWTVPGHAGYAKIGWGTPGDFDRCRVEIGQEIAEHDPATVARWMNQICAQWHHDATGFWPGHAPAERAASGIPAPALSLVAAGGPQAPAAWFANPQFAAPTHLTVTDDGRVFGHIAQWGVCHIGFDGVCVEAPPSQTDYAYYATGQVALDDGTAARTGVISLGGGHAGRGSLRAATEHYDSTSCAVADVTVGEDEHGIWCAGWIRPGTTDEQVVALRASDVSGDWREVGGNLELVAALAVNVGGFPVARVDQGIQVMLVAAGIIHDEPEVDQVQALASAIAAALDKQQRDAVARVKRMGELVQRVGRDH